MSELGALWKAMDATGKKKYEDIANSNRQGWLNSLEGEERDKMLLKEGERVKKLQKRREKDGDVMDEPALLGQPTDDSDSDSVDSEEVRRREEKKRRKVRTNKVRETKKAKLALSPCSFLIGSLPCHAEHPPCCASPLLCIPCCASHAHPYFSSSFHIGGEEGEKEAQERIYGICLI